MAILFVQFLHPGSENISSKQGTIYPWNKGNHKRKFIVTSGYYVKSLKEQSPTSAEELYFWGEWEPTSKIIDVYKNGSNILPHCSHSPFLQVQKSGNVVCQGINTDPFVFNNHFLYGLCRQMKYKSLRTLDSFSIILFGSNKKSSFVVDTVFVVKKGKMNYLNKEPIDSNNCCQTSMYPPYYGAIMGNYKMPGSSKLTMYEGVNFYEREQYQGMFSYVPCKLGCKNSGFARVEITNKELNSKISSKIKNKTGYKLISDNLNQGIRNTPLNNPSLTPQIVWESVTEIILSKGYYLGFCLDYKIKNSVGIQIFNKSNNCGCKPSNHNKSC